MSQKEIIYTVKKALLIWLGICLIFIGLVSLLIPVSPGLILIILGLSLVSKGLEEEKKWPMFSRLKKTVYKCIPKKLRHLNIGLTVKK